VIRQNPTIRKSLWAAFPLLLTGCVIGPTEEGAKPWSYSNSQLGYKLTFPASWGQANDTTYDVYAISPKKNGASFHVRVRSVSGRAADPRPLNELAAGEVSREYDQYGNESSLFPAEKRGNRTVIPSISLFQSGGISYVRKTYYLERGDFFGQIDFIGPNSSFDTDAEFLAVDSSLILLDDL
jgi:hypothetical protein